MLVRATFHPLCSDKKTVEIIFVLGHWPIPESFWPEVTMSVLPPRSAHPNIKFACTNAEPLVIENLPFDKYELEPSPLTQYILSRKQPKTCWQVNFKTLKNTGYFIR